MKIIKANLISFIYIYMKHLDRRDLIAGIAIIIIGVFVALYASSNYQVGTAARMGPGYFPVLLGWSMVFLGFVISLLSIKPKNHEIEPPPFTPRPFIAVSLSTAVFALLITRIGLIPTTIITVVVTASGSDNFQLKRALALSIFLAAISWLIFSLGLQMTLPAFAWEF